MSTYLPPQHGAWAFLGLPLALAAAVTPWSPLLPLLALGWVAAYPLSYAALGLARARRRRRFVRPLAVWTAIALPPALAMAVARPWLLWIGAGYLALFAVNLRYARRNDERALGNDLVFILECAAMVPVTWAVATGHRSWSAPAPSGVPGRVWMLAAVCALVLVSSTLQVKSLVRQRRDPRYRRASQAFAVACLPAALVLAVRWGLPGGLWLVAPFAVLAGRTVVVGRRPLRPGAIGMIELGGFLLIAAGALLAA
jgi:YwiC-like protein